MYFGVRETASLIVFTEFYGAADIHGLTNMSCVVISPGCDVTSSRNSLS